MSIYLVDFENVTSEGLSGVGSLKEGDKVILFYSTKANKISLPIHIEISKSLASFEYKEVLVGGKNALDYQLSTYLGFLIGQSEDTHYYIVSKDRGYEYLSNFWKQTLKDSEEKICIEYISAIKLAKTDKEQLASEEKTEERVEKVTIEHNNQEVKQVAVEVPVADRDEAQVEIDDEVEHKSTKVLAMKSTYNKKSSTNKRDFNKKKPSPMNKKGTLTEVIPSLVVKENVFSSSQNIAKSNEQNPGVEKELRQMIDKELQEEQVKRIVQCFNQARNKQELHRRIVKVLGQDKGTVIYHKIKKLVKKAS